MPARRDSTAEAQRMLDDIVFSGKTKDADGNEIIADTDQRLGVLKWAAARGKRAIHSTPIVEDFGDKDGE